MKDEYVYYCKRGDELETIALVRNHKLAQADFDTLVSAMAKDGYAFTRMVEYKGFEQPNFAACVAI